MKATQIAAVLIASLATIVSGSVSQPGQKQPLKPLVDWLKRTGKESVVRAPILNALDLPAKDMPVRERGFRHEGERLTHVCSVSSVPGYADLLFFAQVDESNGDATVWRTNIEGVLASTIRFTGGVVERVPNEAFKSDFDEEKVIFTTRMRLDQRDQKQGQRTRILPMATSLHKVSGNADHSEAEVPDVRLLQLYYVWCRLTGDG